MNLPQTYADHFLLKNIDCGYSLEPPRRGGSNEYPQSVFWAEIETDYYMSPISEKVPLGHVRTTKIRSLIRAFTANRIIGCD